MIRKRIIFVVPLLYCGTFCPTFPLFRFSSCLHSRLTSKFFFPIIPYAFICKLLLLLLIVLLLILGVRIEVWLITIPPSGDFTIHRYLRSLT